MRYKFRAKCIDTDKWVYGGYYDNYIPVGTR